MWVGRASDGVGAPHPLSQSHHSSGSQQHRTEGALREPGTVERHEHRSHPAASFMIATSVASTSSATCFSSGFG